MAESVEEVSEIFEALGNPVRLSIVQMVAREGNLSCGDILKKFQLSQPTMSHHLNKLVRAGVLVASKEGVRHRYRLNEARLEGAGINLGRMKQTA